MNRGNIISKGYAIVLSVLLIFSGLIFLPSSPISQTAEAASEWEQSSYEDFVNGTFNNLTIKKSGLGADLVFQDCAIKWTKVTPMKNPIKRHGHDMTNIWGTEFVLLFGGVNELLLNWLNDTWIYDINFNSWERVYPFAKPIGRSLHAISSIWGTQNVLLFGGSDWGNNKRLDDTWIYDFGSNNWTNKMPVINPPARAGHAMASVWGTDKIVLFGGFDKSQQMLDDTWVYNCSNNSWIKKTPATKPTARYGHKMSQVWGTDKFVLFGGSGQDHNILDETWIYDYSNNTWTKKTHFKKPLSYIIHAMAYLWGTDKVVLYGGHQNINIDVLDETWIYDLSDNTWTNKSSDIKPSYRRSHALATIHGTDKIVLFGGYGKDWLDDTWILKVNPNKYYKNGTYISISYDTGHNSSFKTISWNGDTSTNTSLKFQFKTGLTEPRLNKTLLLQI